MSETPVPQADPRAGYLAQQTAIDSAIAAALRSGRYVLGPETQAFEREFATYIGCRHGIGVASGTEALVLALKALDLQPSDYVVTVSHTAVATVAAIELAGLAPLLIDIDPATHALDPAEFARVLANPPKNSSGKAGRIGAVIPVHLYGLPADMSAILDLTRQHGVRVIEDCAQSHGALLGGWRAGSIGDIAAFSFYPTKNLGALGDGGGVVTNDEALARRVVELREYGWRERYVSHLAGMNSRLDELQAAILRPKLRRLDADNARRQAIAGAYDEGLKGRGYGLPKRRAGATHVFHQYVLQRSRRAELQAALTARGIGTNIHYPVPVHLQPAYRGRIALGPSGMTHSERAAAEVLSLPMFPQLTDAQVVRVITALRELSSD
jgi:dTDP-4-amino-4,6-dideoxygalactose transaminase